jgi:hypothetical protein
MDLNGKVSTYQFQAINHIITKHKRHLIEDFVYIACCHLQIFRKFKTFLTNANQWKNL